jgi:NADH:ubiquinone reductase (H+-translocating)
VAAGEVACDDRRDAVATVHTPPAPEPLGRVRPSDATQPSRRHECGRPDDFQVIAVSDVVVIGGGYAGIHAAHAAARAGGHVTLIEPTGRHGLVTRGAAIAGGRSPSTDRDLGLGELFATSEVAVIASMAVHLEPATRTVTTADGRRWPGESVVVTSGAVPAPPPVEGAADHAWQLGSADDAVALRGHLAAAGSVVVVGGGATGVQLAAEIAGASPDRPVTLIEAGGRLLPGEPRRLGRGAMRILRAAGVDVRLATTVESITADGAHLADGSWLDGAVLWAGGWQPTGAALLPTAQVTDGRLRLDPDLQVVGHPGIFAAGDVAHHLDVAGRPLPMSAQIAVQAGAAAGRNAVTWSRSGHTRQPRLIELGRVIEMGADRGVARIGPVRLGTRSTDRLVPLLHLAIDLRHLWQLGGLDAARKHAPGRAAASGTDTW